MKPTLGRPRSAAPTVESFERSDFLISSRPGELLRSAIIVWVQFERSLVRANRFVFLVGLKIAVADTFKAEDSGKLFLLAGSGQGRGAFVGCFSVTEPAHSQVSTTQKIER